MKTYYDTDEIKNKSIADYCYNKGLVLEGRGGVYRRLKDHDSLVINIDKNLFSWNSRNASGSIIDFAMNVFGFNFYEALKDIADTTYYMPQNIVQADKSISNMINKGNETKGGKFDPECIKYVKVKHAYAYLNKTRNIDKEVIDLFLQNKILAQGGIRDKETKEVKNDRNVVFRNLDEKGNLVGIEIVGTNTNFRFKKIVEGSKDGIYYRQSKEPVLIILTESTIDMLSYYEIYKNNLDDKNFWLVSMTGLKDIVLKDVVKEIENINEKKENKIRPDFIIAVDNDKAGLNFYNKIKEKEEFKDIKFKLHIPKNKKDWNELLSYKKELKRRECKNKNSIRNMGLGV